MTLSTGWCQQASQIPSFRASTDVVLVPVIVRNKTGAIEALKPEQFQVMEDGKPQAIVSAELIKTGGTLQRRSKAGEFSNELLASKPARLTIIGIDTINTPYLDQIAAREQILKYLARSITPGNQIAILTMNRDGSVRLLHDITSDTATLAKTLNELTGSLPGQGTDTNTVPAQNRLQAERQIMGQVNSANVGAGDPQLTIAANEAQAFQVFKESTGGEGAYELRRNMDATLSAMRQIGEAFAGAPGWKSFVWITGSFPFDINSSADLVSPKYYFSGSTQSAGSYYTGNSGALPPLPDSNVTVSDDELSPLKLEFRSLMQQFATSNIALYPVDARGLLTLNLEASDEQNNELLKQLDRTRAQTSQMSMEAMARMTGGKTCYNKNEIVSCVHDASTESEQYYLLSYNRDKKNNKQGWRKLTVKVDVPDADIRARSGYFFGSEAADKNARNRAISTAARSTMQFSSVQFSAKFLETVAEGNKKVVSYEIFVPPATVAAMIADDKLALEFFAVAATPKDPKSDITSEVIGKNLPPEAIQAIQKQGIAYKNKLKLTPGKYTVHFMVRNAGNNIIGTVVAPLTVP